MWRVLASSPFSGPAGAMLDLHGYSATDAVRVVIDRIDFLKARTDTEGPQMLQIVVGLGNHSPGGMPVLGPLVTRLLEDRGHRVSKAERKVDCIYHLIAVV